MDAMDNQFVVKWISWTPVINAVFLGFSGIICFIVAYQHGYVSIYVPLISETGDRGTSRILFMTATMYGGIISFCIVIYRYLIMRFYLNKTPNLDWTWDYFNALAGTVGLVASFFLMLITPFPIFDYPGHHTVIASIYFVCCIIYTCCDAYLYSALPMAKSCMNKTRVGMVIGEAVTGIFMILLYPISLHLWKMNNEQEVQQSLKSPEHNYFTALLIVCIFEWVMYVTYLMYLLTFLSDFIEFRLVLEVVPKRMHPGPRRLTRSDDQLNTTSFGLQEASTPSRSVTLTRNSKEDSQTALTKTLKQTESI